MIFLSCVPQTVRESIAGRLDGNETESAGWRAALAKAGPDDRPAITAEIECLERLGCDPRMKAAYETLSAAPGVTAAGIDMFIGAAWIAHRNYDTVRRNINAARVLAKQVSEKALQLAAMLHQAPPEVAQYLPSQFFSLPALIERADHDQDHRNFAMWRGLKKVVLGSVRETVKDDDGQAAGIVAPHAEPQFLEPGARRDTEALTATRDAIRYAWEVAPEVADALVALGRAASERDPAESGFVGDGIASRKKAPKAQYLRGFLSLLLADQFELSPAIIEAVAVTATVVLNWPDDPVIASEVRNARAQLAT